MNKAFLFTIFATFLILVSPLAVFAQENDHTAREEAEGKEVWEKLQAKQIECQNFTDDNYASLGEYFMGQAIGNTQRHEVMNNMMIQMMGEEGEKQAHIAMGKQMSGCGAGGGGNFMMGYGNWNSMMSGWGGFGILGWLSMLLFWVLLILGVIALFRYVVRSEQDKSGKTPLEILKERYAKGEIDKKEFEEKKKDLI